MMSHETILRRMVAVGLTALMLVGCVSGCANDEPEASSDDSSKEQDGRYATDMLECGILHTSDIDGIYSTQIGNPNLYSNDYEAALDCMHREGAAPMDYSLDDLKYDMYERPHDGEPIIDLHSPAAASCLIANNINMVAPDEPLEELW